MKKIILLLVWLIGPGVYAQVGKLATAPWKTLIDKTCKSENEFPLLKGYTAKGETALSFIEDTDQYSVSVFSKDNSLIVFFKGISKGESLSTILDVIEIKGIPQNQELKINVCRFDGADSSQPIMALVERSIQEWWKAVKAWIFQLDRIRVEAISPNRVTCLGAEPKEDRN